MDYIPAPLDTSDVELSEDVQELTEKLARNTHALWAKRKMEDGWRYGARTDEESKQHASLVPYEELPEEMKEYDRSTAMGAIRVLLALGYEIKRTDG